MALRLWFLVLFFIWGLVNIRAMFRLNRLDKLKNPVTSGRDRLCGLVIWVSDYKSIGPGLDCWRYQIFLAVSLEWGPLSLVSKTEELLGRKSSCSGLENGEYGRRDSSRWHLDTLYPQKLSLTSLTSGGRPVGIVRSRIEDTEFVFSDIWNRTRELPASSKVVSADYATECPQVNGNVFNCLLTQCQAVDGDVRLSFVFWNWLFATNKQLNKLN
jgi:hypothetical protein